MKWWRHEVGSLWADWHLVFYIDNKQGQQGRTSFHWLLLALGKQDVTRAQSQHFNGLCWWHYFGTSNAKTQRCLADGRILPKGSCQTYITAHFWQWHDVNGSFIGVCCWCMDPRQGLVVAVGGMAPLAPPITAGSCRSSSAECPVPTHPTRVLCCIPEVVS